VEAGGNEEV
jgi:hypothetical protein